MRGRSRNAVKLEAIYKRNRKVLVDAVKKFPRGWAGLADGLNTCGFKGIGRDNCHSWSKTQGTPLEYLEMVEALLRIPREKLRQDVPWRQHP